VKVYLDECIDWRLSRDIVGHDVRTAHDMEWLGLKNGELLLRVQAEFDAFVTVDRNLAFQQNVATLSLAVIVLRARSNRLGDLQLLLAPLHAALRSAQRSRVTIVD
jgi:hypothetical protein